MKVFAADARDANGWIVKGCAPVMEDEAGLVLWKAARAALNQRNSSRLLRRIAPQDDVDGLEAPGERCFGDCEGAPLGVDVKP